MKSKFSFVVSVLLLSLLICACSPKDGAVSPDDTTSEIPENGIYYEYSDGGNSERIVSATIYKDKKAVSVKEYDYWGDGRLKSITTKVDGNIYDIWSYNYTDGGLLSQMVRQYTEDGSDMRDDYRYNEKGKIATLSWYENNEYFGGFRYSYNENGDPTLEEQLDANGDVIIYTEYKFDELDPKKTVSSHKYMYGSVTSYSLYTYENDLLSRITNYTSTDVITSESKYEYDTMGRISKVYVCDGDGTVRGYTESLYDKDGFNYKDICYENGTPIYSYEYTKDGSPVYHEY